jgi:hypothetical protein
MLHTSYTGPIILDHCTTLAGVARYFCGFVTGLAMHRACTKGGGTLFETLSEVWWDVMFQTVS